jgi:hypothetical protein
MDELPPSEASEQEIPRWVHVPVGAILGLFTLLCGVASLALLFVPNKQSPVLCIVVGLILLLGCLWVLEKCFRLLTGSKKQDGLLSPTTLRVVSLFLPLFAVAGFFTDYYREMGPVAIFQGVMYIFGFFRLRALARQRESDHDERTKE